MINRRFAVLTMVVAAPVGGALTLLVGTTPITAICTGLAFGTMAGVIPAALRDGRFPGSLSSGGARRVIVVANLIILGAGMPGVAGLNLDRGTDFSLMLLVLATGYAAFLLGAATVIEEVDDPAR
ncbi:MAG: hypothetical protein CL477_12640 [Acidobacteria bacterium]|jgi:hypothetical protein|nr:hypothetical protein [Acidobacteriota bacterium]MDP7339945.1 hypothetical protein [Vicinamibacterales bacterium]MDP7480512.1 hypothetical protein [Vicinamibacterales bacterium]MDP7692762.1 hypothetical protein [Vicinamibacterales bacterium]HJN43572.1 hypothetical protein [Vicinamibacterales bacterium]|tara:strand:- start:324 stop:698 length:375 start_codon:yes stop_codon:yes gene_type:complete